jgi:hypothetical protein
MQQHQPAGLGQPEIGETPIQLGSPPAGNVRKLHPETMFVGQWHRGTHD